MLTEFKAEDYLEALKLSRNTDEIGKKVKARRKNELKISQETLSKNINISKPTIVKIENGSSPTLEQIFELSTGLDCDPGYLIGLHETYHCDHIDTIKRTGLAEETIIVLEKLTEDVQKKKYGHEESATLMAFINYFISEIDQFGTLLSESLRNKVLEDLLAEDELRDEIIEAYERSKYPPRQKKRPLLSHSRSHGHATRNMTRELKNILIDKYDDPEQPEINENEIYNLATTKVHSFFDYLDGTDQRVNNFALTDTFLQIVRGFVEDSH